MEVDAIRITQPMTIVITCADDKTTMLHGSPGDFLVTEADGAQFFVSPEFFSAAFDADSPDAEILLLDASVDTN